MKKLLFGFVAFAAGTALLFGCGTKEAPVGTEQQIENENGEVKMGLTGLANPIVSYESAAAVEEKTGCKLLVPENASDVSFSVISGELAQANFYINGHKYNLRAQKNVAEDFDIAGVYDDKFPANMIAFIKGDFKGVGRYKNGGRWADWSENDITFSLTTLDECEESEFMDAFYFAAGGKLNPGDK